MKDLIGKIGSFEARLEREEKNKLELQEKLIYSEKNQKEMLNLVRSLQKEVKINLIYLILNCIKGK